MNVLILGEGSQLNDGRYVLDCRLGAGGMATVWLATDTRLHRQVAIKLPSDALAGDEAFAQRFEREARTAAQLSHPNLVPVYDYGTEGERPYLVSEYIEGANLAELREQGRAPETETLARALLDALSHIHASGIVHRDIKPANVLVDERGRILLTDFGIALSAEATSLTGTGNVIGTKTYLAPEVLHGERAGPRSDLYGCGMVLAEQIDPGDADRVRRLVDALTAKDPADRPPDADSALAALERANHVVTAISPVDAGTTHPFDPPTERTLIPPPALPPPVTAPRAPERVLEGTGRVRGMPPPPGASRPSPSRARPIVVALAAAAAAAIALVIALNGDGDEGGSSSGTPSVNSSETGGKDGGAAQEPAPAETETTEAAPVEEVTETTTTSETDETAVPASSDPDPARGKALNDEGYSLIQAGDFEGALPLLSDAVAAFPPGSTDINYGYALFNYAQALRETGSPAEAIPLLEERLSLFPEEQVETVEQELALAQEQAGAE